MNPQPYTGKGDAFLDTRGNAVDFGSEASADKVFAFTITNANAGAQKVLLTPSYAPSVLARVIKTGVIAYTGGATDLTASGSPTTVEEFLAYISLNPTVITKTKIKSNNAAQLQKALIFSIKEPFADPKSDRINIGTFVSEFASNDKLATITREYQLDNRTELSLEIPGNSETTITFYCGLSLNTAQALQSKKNIAMMSEAVQNTKAALARG